jgi:hypothetical protein
MTARGAVISPRPATVSHLAEIRRLRNRLAAALADRDQLAAMLGQLADAIDPAAELRLRRAIGAEQYERGRADGWHEGYEAAGRDMARRWDEIARPVARGGPGFAELERRRWGASGREHFGGARPGDFPGRGEVSR